MSDELTRTERADLQRVARMRAKVARGAIEVVKAQRLAEFERELQARYAVDDAAWSELTAAAKAQVQQTDEELARRCEELGIRPEFRPRLTLGWYSAGANGSRDRQAELRKLARLELEAAGKAARQRIDAGELEAVTELLGMVADPDRGFAEYERRVGAASDRAADAVLGMIHGRLEQVGAIVTPRLASLREAEPGKREVLAVNIDVALTPAEREKLESWGWDGFVTGLLWFLVGIIAGGGMALAWLWNRIV